MTFLYKAHRPPSVGFLHSASVWPYSFEKEHVELRGKVAIVTGGAVRIGRALSLALAREGIGICVHYGSSRDAAEKTVAEIRALGVDATAVQADLSRPREAAG